MKIYSIKIRKSMIFLIMLIFPILKPEMLALATVVGGNTAALILKALTLWNLISIIFSLVWVLCIIKSKRKKIQIYTWLMILLCLSMTISTIKMGSWDIKDIWQTFGNFIMISILASIYGGKKYIDFLQAWYYLITFWMVINSTTIYLYFPNGMYQSNHYLFALDNVSFLISLIGFFIGFIYNLLKFEKIKINFLFLYGFIALSYFYCKAGTGMAISACCVMILLFYKIPALRIFDYSKLLLSMIGAFLIIVIFRSVSWAIGILDLIGKDLTYNGRLDIWFAAMYAFSKSMFWGYGISTEIVQKAIQMSGIRWISGIGHLHNIVFEFLIKGGLIGSTFAALLLCSPRRKMSLCENNSIFVGANLLFFMIWISFMFEYRLALYPFWVAVFTFYNFKDLMDVKRGLGEIKQ